MDVPFTDAHVTTREMARSFLQAWYDGGKGPERIYNNGRAFDKKAWQGSAKDLGMAGTSLKRLMAGRARRFGPYSRHGGIL